MNHPNHEQSEDPALAQVVGPLGDDHASFMEMIVDLLPDMVFVKDADSLCFVLLNQRAEALLGYDRSQLVGKSDFDFFPADQAAAFVAKDREVLAGGKVVEIAAEPIGTAHGERILHTKKIPLSDSAGKQLYLLGISEDITDRHSAENDAAAAAARTRNRIAASLAADGPEIVFQPIVDLSTRAVVGAEALSRFTSDPYRAPDVWFREAAEVGLGIELELAAICTATAGLVDLPAPMYLSVNASPRVAMAPIVQRHLESVDLTRLVLELTEHDDVEDYDTLQASLAPLRAAGLRLAVDDTGSGYSSLRHILNLEPDIIKLDRELTRGIDTDPARRALASALITFRDDIGSTVVAEGIETEAELNTLCELGLLFGQGYFLGRPAPLSELQHAT